MPLITCDKEVLDRLYDAVSQSVVTIARTKGGTEKQNDLSSFSTGFIIHSGRDQVLICVHQSIIKVEESILVCFSDGSSEPGSVFIRNTPSGHAVVSVNAAGRRRRMASFNELPVKRQSIFTIAVVRYGHRLGLMSGTVIMPTCEAKTRFGTYVSGSKNIFAMTCPAAGPHLKRGKGAAEQLIGAAVFDMEGLVVGTIDSVDQDVYDLKFSKQACSFVNDLELSLKERNVEISLSRGEKVSQKGSITEEAGTSRKGGQTSGAGSKKRSRDSFDECDTRTERGLPSDQVEANMEIVGLEKMKQALQRFVTTHQR